MSRYAKAIRIWLLKRQLRAAYRAYMNSASYLDCGQAMADHLTGRVSEAKAKCNRILDKLAALDPDCPCTSIR